jgi:hypothetical protein
MASRWFQRCRFLEGDAVRKVIVGKVIMWGRLSPHKAFSASRVGSSVLPGKWTALPDSTTINRDGSARLVQVLQCAPGEIISATIFAD